MRPTVLPGSASAPMRHTSGARSLMRDVGRHAFWMAHARNYRHIPSNQGSGHQPYRRPVSRTCDGEKAHRLEDREWPPRSFPESKLRTALHRPAQHRPFYKHRVDFCLSVEGPIPDNAYGITEMTIPSVRCALARDVGSRTDNKAAQFLYDQWLPGSREKLSGHPLIFHYVNVGPNVQAHEAITDVYMPIA